MPLKEHNSNQYYYNTLANIQKHIPDFETLFESYEIYPLTFEFGNFLFKNINNSAIVQKSSQYINEALDTKNQLVEDLIVLQVFQLFYNHSKESKIIENSLSPYARIIFNRFNRLYK